MTNLVALRVVMRLGNVSQADLARGLGCSRAWVHDVVSGRVPPSPAFIRDVPIVLAERLGVDAPDVGEIRRWLFDDELDEETPSVLGQRIGVTTR